MWIAAQLGRIRRFDMFRKLRKVAFGEVKGERSKLVSQVDDFTRDQYLRKF